MKRWLTLTVTPDTGRRRQHLARALVAFGGRAVRENVDGDFVTYLPEPSDADADSVADEAARLLRSLTGDPGLRVAWEWQDHEDWKELWRRGLGPRQITDRLVVVPTWEPWEADGDSLVIRLDPGMAFGTAEHATTRGCLRLMDGAVSPGNRILDVGSGSGILSIGAALLGAGRVLAVEADPLACEAARENLVANEVASVVELVEARVAPPFLDDLDPFHGVVANLETGLLTPLLDALVAAVAPGGWLIVSGIQDHEAHRIRGTVGGEACALEAEDSEEGWWSARFRKSGPGSPRSGRA